MTKIMNDIFSITKGQLQDILVEAGIKKFAPTKYFIIFIKKISGHGMRWYFYRRKIGRY